MSKSRYAEAQIIGALKQLEAGREQKMWRGRSGGPSPPSMPVRPSKYEGMDVSQAQKSKQSRDGNTRLQKLVADMSLDKEMLKAVILKNGWGS